MGEKKRRGEAAGTPPEILHMTMDKLDAMPAEVDQMVFEVGTRGLTPTMAAHYARYAAVQAGKAALLRPGCMLTVTVGGWESDPREVRDIPEAMAMFRAFGERLREIEEASGDYRVLSRLDSFSRTLVKLAMGLVEYDAIQITPYSDPVHGVQWRADMEKAKRVDPLIDAMAAERAKQEPKQ